MKPVRHLLSSWVPVLVAVASAGPWVGCGGDVPLGTMNEGGSPQGTGGSVSTGGVGGSNGDAAVGGSFAGTGGGVGGGGMGAGGAGVDAPIATGGKVGTGGIQGTGGGTRCGTIAGLSCPTGLFCDLMGCGMPDASGVCRPTGEVCGAEYAPVCGCDGKTYSNDCTRIQAGVLKASDGACNAGTGGATKTGGVPGTGGSSGAGGKGGSGGAGGTGGSTRVTCGGLADLPCPTGQTCDIDSHCATVFDAMGTCVPTGGGCTADWVPVCGCDGKTYSNDCTRISKGVSKASDGECPTVGVDGGAPKSYPTAYLQWEAPGGVAGTGPVVVVSAAGWADTWDNVPGFSPEGPLPSNATGTYTLNRTQTDDLFSRLASVSFASLPHTGYQGWECYPRLYFRLCEGCTATTLNYQVPQELAPEMETVWAWFDQLLGNATRANPRNYCNMTL